MKVHLSAAYFAQGFGAPASVIAVACCAIVGEVGARLGENVGFRRKRILGTPW
jgi:hypothetical protein